MNMNKDIQIDGCHEGDIVTLTRSAGKDGQPPLSVTGRLTSIVVKKGRPSGGTIQAPDGPWTLDLDAERMLRLYGVTQTLTRCTES